MQKHLIAFLACGLQLAADAQAPPGTAPDTARYRKHELGLTASPVLEKFFANNRSLPLGVIYRRHLSSRSALRLRTVGIYNRRDTTMQNGFGLTAILDGTRSVTWSADAWLGYERIHVAGRRWQLSVGAEVGAGYSRRLDVTVMREYNPPPDAAPFTTNIEIRTRYWRVQARAFAGVSFALSENIRLFAETAVLLAHQRVKQHAEGTGIYDDPRFGSNFWFGPSDRNNRTFSGRWRPVQLVGASARF